MTEEYEYSYRELLMTPQWYQRRLEILELDQYTCRKCGWKQPEQRHELKQICTPDHLEIHHLYYIRGCFPWEYPDEALMTRCDECHREEGGEIVLPGFRRGSDLWFRRWLDGDDADPTPESSL